MRYKVYTDEVEKQKGKEERHYIKERIVKTFDAVERIMNDRGKEFIAFVPETLWV